MKITASIVLYYADSRTILALVNDLLRQGVDHVYLVDNSASNHQAKYLNDSKIEYLHNPTNPGFGAAHNMAIERALNAQANYHFIINPDIQLGVDVVSSMVNYMSQNKGIGLMMPQIRNSDDSIQFLPKLLPTPWSIIRRKFKRPTKSYQRFIDTYELRLAPSNQVYICPIISGCFSLLNLSAIRDVGAFDESFFLYFEDFDLSRRINQKFKTIYFPLVHVIHGYDSGANKKFKLLLAFAVSAIKYFNKWGWFYDLKREKINQETLSQFNR
jgi:hypothetical protein